MLEGLVLYNHAAVLEGLLLYTHGSFARGGWSSTPMAAVLKGIVPQHTQQLC